MARGNAQMAKTFREKLVDLLVADGIIKEEQLAGALEVQRTRGGDLSKILVELKFVEEKDFVTALSKKLNVPAINLSKLDVDAEVVKIIPEQVARAYQLIAISKMRNQLTVAMSDPLNVLAIDDIKVLTGYSLKAVVSPPAQIKEAIDRYYVSSAAEGMHDILEDISSVEVLEEKGDDGTPASQELLRMVADAPVIRLTNKLISEGVGRKASDILIEPMEKRMRVRYRVDGLLAEGQHYPVSLHSAVVSRIKVMSNLDIAEHRVPQDGRFKLRLGGKETDFRVSILPTTLGEKAVLRILDTSSLGVNLESLGFEQDEIQKIEEAVSRPYGMVVVCGPTGSGKTTTLYSMLKKVDSVERNLVTVEDPVEYVLEGINQVPIREAVGLTFPVSLRSILRQDPDIIMIGEVRDFETVDIAIKSALTGHLVLTTLHTTTAAGSIVRFVNMGVEPFLIAATVIIVVSQRLLRKVCEQCREELDVPVELRRRLQVYQDGKFYHGAGCRSCKNTGYSGRSAAGEIMVADDEMRELILNRSSETVITQKARQAGMRSLHENAMRMAASGVTTLEEVFRVTGQDIS